MTPFGSAGRFDGLVYSRVMQPSSSNAGSLSELTSLLDLATTLNSSGSSEAVLDATLEFVMRELQTERGALFVRRGDGVFEVRAARGLPRGCRPPWPSARL